MKLTKKKKSNQTKNNRRPLNWCFIFLDSKGKDIWHWMFLNSLDIGIFYYILKNKKP